MICIKINCFNIFYLDKTDILSFFIKVYDKISDSIFRNIDVLNES